MKDSVNCLSFCPFSSGIPGFPGEKGSDGPPGENGPRGPAGLTGKNTSRGKNTSWPGWQSITGHTLVYTKGQFRVSN